jgi:hypothetical protein
MEILPEHGIDGNLKCSFRRDKPLSLKQVNRTPEIPFSLDLAGHFTNAKQEETALLILHDVILESQGAGRAISHSRNRNHYSGRQVFDGLLYTYRNVVSAVDGLARIGLIETRIADNSGPSGQQSIIMPTDLLQEKIDYLRETVEKPPLLGTNPVQLVRLKDANKRRADYRTTEQTREWCMENAAINDATLASNIDFMDTPGVEKRGQFLVIDGGGQEPQFINTAHDQIYSVFNRSWNEGGRKYGHWTQQIPHKGSRLYRDRITINGSPTSEYDYNCLHPQLVYAMAGHKLQGDAYTIDGWERETVKPAFNIMINAEGETKAKREAQAINALWYYRIVPDRRAGTRLMDAIRHRHKPIAHLFHSGLGRRLMRIDSDIMGRVIAELLKMGICPIPIHDSARVETRHFETLKEIMERNLDKALQRLSREGEYTRAA